LVCYSQRSILKGENQIEKILCYGLRRTPPSTPAPVQATEAGPVHAARIFTKSGEDYSLTAGNTTVILAPTNPRHE
jgi:hypothetical protein